MFDEDRQAEQVHKAAVDAHGAMSPAEACRLRDKRLPAEIADHTSRANYANAAIHSIKVLEALKEAMVSDHICLYDFLYVCRSLCLPLRPCFCLSLST